MNGGHDTQGGVSDLLERDNLEEEIRDLNKKIIHVEEQRIKLKRQTGVLQKTERETRSALVEYSKMEDKMDTEIVKLQRQQRSATAKKEAQNPHEDSHHIGCTVLGSVCVKKQVVVSKDRSMLAALVWKGRTSVMHDAR